MKTLPVTVELMLEILEEAYLRSGGLNKKFIEVIQFRTLSLVAKYPIYIHKFQNNLRYVVKI